MEGDHNSSLTTKKDELMGNSQQQQLDKELMDNLIKQRIACLEEKMTENENAYKQKIENLSAECRDLKKKNADLEAELEEKKAKIDELEEANADLEADLEEKEGEIAELEEKNANLETELEEKNEENDEFERKDAELKVKRSTANLKRRMHALI